MKTVVADDADCIDRYKNQYKFNSWWVDNYNFNKTCGSQGKIEIANCLSDIGTKIPPNKHVMEGRHLYECLQNGDGSVSFQSKPHPTADCIDATNQKHAYGTRWAFGNFLLKCFEGAEGRIIGCLTDKGSIIEANKYFVEGNSTAIKHCISSGRSWSYRSYGCLNSTAGMEPNEEANRIAHGDRWFNDPEKEMRCDSIGIQPYACHFEVNSRKQRLFIGGWLQEGGNIHTCSSEKGEPIYRKMRNNDQSCDGSSTAGQVPSYKKVFAGGSTGYKGIFWKCSLPPNQNTKPVLRPVGCQGARNEIIPFGSSFTYDGTWFSCEGKSIPDTAGLQHSNLSNSPSSVAFSLPNSHSTGISNIPTSHSSRTPNIQSSTVKQRPIGCMDSYGNMVKFGETFSEPSNDGQDMMEYRCDEPANQSKDPNLKEKKVNDQGIEVPRKVFTGCHHEGQVVKPGKTTIEGNKLKECDKNGNGLRLKKCVMDDQKMSETVFGVWAGARWCCYANCRCHFAGCLDRTKVTRNGPLAHKYLTEYAKANKRIIQHILDYCGGKREEDFQQTSCVTKIDGKTVKIDMNKTYEYNENCTLKCVNNGWQCIGDCTTTDGAVIDGCKSKDQESGRKSTCPNLDSVQILNGSIVESKSFEVDEQGRPLVGSTVKVTCDFLGETPLIQFIAECHESGEWKMGHDHVTSSLCHQKEKLDLLKKFAKKQRKLEKEYNKEMKEINKELEAYKKCLASTIDFAGATFLPATYTAASVSYTAVNYAVGKDGRDMAYDIVNKFLPSIPQRQKRNNPSFLKSYTENITEVFKGVSNPCSLIKKIPKKLMLKNIGKAMKKIKKNQNIKDLQGKGGRDMVYDIVNKFFPSIPQRQKRNNPSIKSVKDNIKKVFKGVSNPRSLLKNSPKKYRLKNIGKAMKKIKKNQNIKDLNKAFTFGKKVLKIVKAAENMFKEKYLDAARNIADVVFEEIEDKGKSIKPLRKKIAKMFRSSVKSFKKLPVTSAAFAIYDCLKALGTTLRGSADRKKRSIEMDEDENAIKTFVVVKNITYESIMAFKNLIDSRNFHNFFTKRRYWNARWNVIEMTLNITEQCLDEQGFTEENDIAECFAKTSSRMANRLQRPFKHPLKRMVKMFKPFEEKLELLNHAAKKIELDDLQTVQNIFYTFVNESSEPIEMEAEIVVRHNRQILVLVTPRNFTDTNVPVQVGLMRNMYRDCSIITVIRSTKNVYPDEMTNLATKVRRISKRIIQIVDFIFPNTSYLLQFDCSQG